MSEWMKTKNLVAGWAGALTIWAALATNPEAIQEWASLAAGVVAGTGDLVVSALNALDPTITTGAAASVAGAAAAGVAAPIWTAVGSLYLANTALDWAWVDNKVARRLAQLGSVVAWFGAGSVAQNFILWGAAAKWVWDIGKFAWSKTWKSTAAATA